MVRLPRVFTGLFLIAIITIAGAGFLFFQQYRQTQLDQRSSFMARRALQLLNQSSGNRAQLKRAIKLAERARQLNPQNHHPYFILAMASLEQQRQQDAIRFLEQAIERAPKQLNFRSFLADILVSTGQPAKAILHLQTVLRNNPHDMECLFLLSQCLRQQKDPAGERKNLTTLLDIAPDHYEARLALIQLDIEEHQWDSAIQNARHVLNEKPDHERAQTLLKAAEQQQSVLSDRNGALMTSASFPPARFTEVSHEIGIAFHHENGESDFRYLPELLGSGVAIFDSNNDGYMDIYFANAKQLTRTSSPAPVATNVFYQNMGNGYFQLNTEGSGLFHYGFATGISVGDYDNDGSADLYLTCYGPNVLFRNNGDGTYLDVSQRSGVDDSSMGTGAAWLDADEDGDLDLYVTNYAAYDTKHPLFCVEPGIGPIYCGVQLLTAESDVFFENNGDGTFSRKNTTFGLDRHDGKGMGVVAADLNGDSLTDLFVANDTTPNFLFLGTRGNHFQDNTRTSGAAWNKDAQEEGSMGIAVGDLTNDGMPELLVTNYWLEHNTLYRNHGGIFTDITDRTGLGLRSRRAVGWGTVMADFNRDSRLDLFIGNGHFYDWRGPSEPLEQTPELWINRQHNQSINFVDGTSHGGDYFQLPSVARGVAVGDLDNDRDLDLVVNQWGRHAAVLRNETSSRWWIEFQLVGVNGNRDAVGATMRIDIEGESIFRQRIGGGSYLSSSDPRLLVGLPQETAVLSITVRWPGGKQQHWKQLKTQSSWQLVEGKADALPIQ